jgi:hypothetical protein
MFFKYFSLFSYSYYIKVYLHCFLFLKHTRLLGLLMKYQPEKFGLFYLSHVIQTFKHSQLELKY